MFVRGTWRAVFGASECTTAQTEAQERLGGDSAGEIVFLFFYCHTPFDVRFSSADI